MFEPFIFSQKCHEKAPFSVWISKFAGEECPRTTLLRGGGEEVGETDPTGYANGSFQNATNKTIFHTHWPIVNGGWTKLRWM